MKQLRSATAVLLTAAAFAVACAPQASDSPDPAPPKSGSADLKPPAQSATASGAPFAGAGADPAWQSTGTSVQGRPIRVQTVGHGPRRVLFIGGIHGDEAEGSYTTAELPAAFTRAGLSDRVTLTIVEDANPDGRVAKTRGNANGVDINRNFPASNFDPTDPVNGGKPLTQPETRAVYDLIEDTSPDLVIVVHSWQDKQFINYDGPARDIAERFAATSGLPLTRSNEFAPTPGSLGSYAGRDRKRPLVTIEFLKGSDPKADWEQVRDALLDAISG